MQQEVINLLRLQRYSVKDYKSSSFMDTSNLQKAECQKLSHPNLTILSITTRLKSHTHTRMNHMTNAR